MTPEVKPYAAVIAGVTVLIVAVAAGVALLGEDGFDPIPPSERCLASAGETTVMVDHEQAGNAAVIAGIAVRRGLPARAVTIALATAYQESDLRNLNHGDRDSLGLFQQRPSMGWGTPKQVRNPHYAAGKFYDALVKVDGYERLPITQAADRVQRSAFPEAYADHEAEARVLASALTGNSAAGFSCVVRHDAKAAESEGRNGLTPRADRVRLSVLTTFGKVKTGGYAPGGIDSGHMEGSAHYDGRAVDVFARPITMQNTRRGWAYASYLVANADRLGIQTVIFSDKIWTAAAGRTTAGGPTHHRSVPGTPTRCGTRDHVHVDVVAD